MVTCCFLCQDPVYDNDIEERLDKAISKVVEENGTVRFLLYSYGDILSGRFHDLFATAAYRAKLANPHKEIRLSIVASDEERGQVLSALQKWQYPMPSFMFDEVLSPPTPQGIKDPFAIKKRMQRWMIGQADYVFTYLYDCLHEAVSHARDYAVKSGKALVDLTNPSTYALIREQYGTLPAQACKAMGLWLERKTTPEIAAELGVSRTRVQFLVSEGTRKIHDRLAGQEYQQAEAFCTVFLLGPATYASLSAFQKTVDYLICYKNVKTFCVPTDYLSSAFRYVLEKYKGIDKVQTVCLAQAPTFKGSMKPFCTNNFDADTISVETIANGLLDETALAQVAAPYRISNLRFCPPELVKQIRETFMQAAGEVSFFCDLGKPLPKSILS